MLNAFTVDVEDYFQVSGFADRVRPETWDTFESRVVANTHRLLRLLDRRSVRGTFFVLGWVADRFPELVRDIHKSGHELASHGFWHRLVYDLSPEEFRADLARSVDAIAGASGAPAVGFRAPSFSITRKSLWALQVLAEEGFQFDSSIFPVYHDRYGIPSAERFVHRIDTGAGEVWELPPSVYPVGGLNLPVAGGGYFRLYPAALTAGCLERINRGRGEPCMFYVHPWEVDPDQPRLPGGSRLNRWRHYQNLAATERKLDFLLERLSFGSVGDVLAEQRSRPTRTVPAAALAGEAT